MRVKLASKALSAAELVERPKWCAANWSPFRHYLHWTDPLIRIGHAEFFPVTKHISVCKPGMVWFEGEQRAVLFGYWRRGYFQKLKQRGLTLFRRRPHKGPTCWSVTGSYDRINEGAKTVGAWLSVDPAMSILLRLPVVDKLLDGLPRDDSQPEGNWERLFLVDHQCRWVRASLPFAEPGLYRRQRGQWRYVLTLDDYSRVALPPGDHRKAAIWSLFEPRHCRFDSDRRSLLIPAVADLPLLVSRALTTRSAQLPRRVHVDSKAWWQYENVDRRKALHVARIMRLELA